MRNQPFSWLALLEPGSLDPGFGLFGGLRSRLGGAASCRTEEILYGEFFSWRVLSRPGGLVIFSRRGQEKCDELGIGRGYLTLTDEAGLVVAFAALECAGETS